MSWSLQNRNLLQPYPVRKALRLPHYDYSQPGCHFVTICTKHQAVWFGEVVDETMLLNEAGAIVQEEWNALPEKIPGLELDVSVVMPNHMHGIILLGNTVRYQHAQKKHYPTLSDVIDTFKGRATYRIHRTLVPDFEWKKSFFDCIVRNPRMLEQVRRYIVENPSRWGKDEKDV